MRARLLSKTLAKTRPKISVTCLQRYHCKNTQSHNKTCMLM